MTSLRFLPEQIEQWPVARLKPYERNPRLHSEEQVARLAASLIEYGWTQPILIAGDGPLLDLLGQETERGHSISLECTRGDDTRDPG